MRIFYDCLSKKHQMILRQRGKESTPAEPESGAAKVTHEKDPLICTSQTQSPTTTVKRLSLFSLVGISIVLTMIFCEVTKQISNYSLQYYNHFTFPIPQTIIVVLCELVKLVTTFVRAKFNPPSFSLQTLRGSLRFLLPSVLYAINNNIYYAGLTLVPPPIWLMLCSIRTVVTATIYKFVLKRHITLLQFVGAALIVISIAIAKTPDILQILNRSTVDDETVRASLVNNQNDSINNHDTNANDTGGTVNAIPLAAILLALVASCNSVGSSVYTEQLFKNSNNKGESFLDQQFWLYAYGAIVASTVHFVSRPTYTLPILIQDLQNTDPNILFILVVAVLFASLGGIVVASILKYLDNIVKEYTGSVANILTAVISSLLFPDKFKFTPFIIMSMTSLLSGIYLYETKKAPPQEQSSPRK